MLPELVHVGLLEVVDGELQLVLQANLAVFHGTPIGADDPDDVVNAIDVLQEGGDALQSVGQLGGDGIEIDAAALLEVGELGDLQAVEHDLPADAPGAERGRLPVVFFELDVVLAQVDADGARATRDRAPARSPAAA